VNRKIAFVALILALAPVSRFDVSAKAGEHQGKARDLITKGIDENQRVRLPGNTRPEARREHDRGPVPDDFPLEHMLLQLQRPPELQQEFDVYVEGLTQGSSPNFHQWLEPAQVGERYGLSDSDLRHIERWLRRHGFRVNYVYPNRVVMDISARARELKEAMGVEIHFLEVNGEQHFANMNDPEIPEALAPAIVGIVSMHDFQPHPMVKPLAKYTYTDVKGTFYAVTPPDLAQIYNFNPLFSQGITGTGQTVALVEDTNLFAMTDWTTFQSQFNLAKYNGNLIVTHPNTAGNCADPGVNGDDGEATLDAEYSYAAAPGAIINLATCANAATPGVLIAIQNLVAASPHPYIISVSYGYCEPDPVLGAFNANVFTAYQTAASEGISVFVSSGDEGPDSCDANQAAASHGINVSGLASTFFNVAVGGTDFGDSFHGMNATYWSPTNNGVLQSANGYIREIPWNSSCASVLIAIALGQNPPYGTAGACNNGGTGFRTTTSGSGGPSGCATGAPMPAGSSVVSGTCAGYVKPPWQSGLFGNPNDGVRDLPDVSLFAANGVWGHFYIYCYTDTGRGGNPCTGNPDPTTGPCPPSCPTWNAAGGTSFAAPILAGIQALVNQRTAALTISPTPGQGNPNPVYYAIANAEYGTAAGRAQCNSSTQPLPRRGIASSCVFYDVTEGDIDLNCLSGSPNCYRPSGAQGVLSTGKISGLTLSAGGSGYLSAPTCTITAPHNPFPYNGYPGGSQATCTATISPITHVVISVTLTNAGAGYAPIPLCLISGGSGSGATCTVTGVTVDNTTGYQPAFPATPGWDFATGIGTINAYNLVFDPHWAQGP